MSTNADEDVNCDGEATQFWPAEQPPVTPLEQWGPAPVGTISRGWYWKPAVMRGYRAILKRISVSVKNVALNEYSTAIAPRILIAFLDPNDEATPSQNQEFSTVPTALLAPLSAEPVFFAPSGTVAIVNATNNGSGYDFGMRTPRRYLGIWVVCSRIGTNTAVQVTPVIQYEKMGAG